VTLLVDADGQLYSLLRGEDALGDPQTIQVDADGQLFVVLRGADGVDVAVDANGFLSAVLIGEHAGVAHTISVDAQGRIEAFMLDAESQWGQVLKVGNAELAARLGSSTAWDWRGQVLVSTDFAYGWPAGLLETNGTGAAAVISPAMFLRGGYSAKLTGGSDGSRYADASLRAGANPTSRFGLAVWFACSDTPEYVQLSITYQADDAGYRSRVRIDFDNEQLQVMDSLGAYHDVAAVAPYANPAYFHAFKFVVDLSTGLYERILLDDVEVDISAYAPVALGAGSELITAEVCVFSHAAANDYAFVDSMILTSSEPANSG